MLFTWLTAMAGLAAWFYHDRSLEPGLATQTQTVPESTAWMIAGKLAIDGSGQHIHNGGRLVWARGPHFVLVHSGYQLGGEIPHVGDTVMVTSETALYLLNSRTAGTRDYAVPPREKGTLTGDDKLDILLPKGTEVEIRQIDEGFYPGEDHSFLWFRVAKPKGA